MMDIDRVDELCRKLSHSRLEIRSRAVDNILFKLEKGLITISGLISSSIIMIFMKTNINTNYSY